VPLLLDLFCGAGGAAMGYARAGFDVVGVDIVAQPHYPFTFVLDDALAFPFDGFDAVHASPPCHLFTAYRRRDDVAPDALDLIGATCVRLAGSPPVPWVIENVPGAPLRSPVQLCGSSFGLPVRRHRLFESNVLLLVPPCFHGVQRGDFPQSSRRVNRRRTMEIGVGRIPVAQQRQGMGIDWMTRDELTQAIPPAYTELIGHQLMAAL
jgi:DNA (cytosine-5)-methyltransferase 1